MSIITVKKPKNFIGKVIEIEDNGKYLIIETEYCAYSRGFSGILCTLMLLDDWYIKTKRLFMKNIFSNYLIKINLEVGGYELYLPKNIKFVPELDKKIKVEKKIRTEYFVEEIIV